MEKFKIISAGAFPNPQQQQILDVSLDPERLDRWRSMNTSTCTYPKPPPSPRALHDQSGSIRTAQCDILRTQQEKQWRLHYALAWNGFACGSGSESGDDSAGGGPAQSDTVLKATEVQKLFPASVCYKGQFAASQQRNSGGVKFSDG